MDTVSHFLPDVNDELAWREEREDLWEQEPAYVPTQYDRLVEAGMSPEGAADVVDFLADDGLPVCADPPDIADDGLLVVVWPRMYPTKHRQEDMPRCPIRSISLTKLDRQGENK
jgi:hypothetical protein